MLGGIITFTLNIATLISTDLLSLSSKFQWGWHNSLKGFKTVFHGKERTKRKYIIEVERDVQAHEIWGIGVV